MGKNEKVMQSKIRLHQSHQPTTKRLLPTDADDFFPTPAWATLALLAEEEVIGDILEPACGDGDMARVLTAHGHTVVCSDLHPRVGHPGGDDFLNYPADGRRYANVITNPPFNQAERFVHAGLRVAEHKLALLLRLAFLEGAARSASLFAVRPPTRVIVFSERITFYPKAAERKGSGTTAYGWFVWDQATPDAPTTIAWTRPGLKPNSRAHRHATSLHLTLVPAGAHP